MELFAVNHWWAPWLVAAGLASVLYWGLGWPVLFVVTLGIIAGLLGGQLETARVARRTVKIEEQLADAIDLMVAALQAGAGTLSALNNAVAESRKPLRPQLEEVLGRIRYGDDPQVVLAALQARVPLEVFRLFVSVLSVHWETGGSLGPTLSTVCRVVRDRIEVNRRVRSLTAQSRLSVIVIIFITYFLALVMWRMDADRMRGFLTSAAGQWLAAGAILFQGLGIVWSAALSRLKY